MPEKFKDIGEDVVKEVLSWFVASRELFIFRGGAFLASLYPDFAPIEDTLLALVRTGGPAEHIFVDKLLRAYQGQHFLHRVAKALVSALPNGDPLLNEVSVALDSSGVVSGQFGFVDEYDRKKSEMDDWTNDKDEKEKAFGNRHILGLDRQIPAERRRSMEDMQVRMRGYASYDPTLGGAAKNKPAESESD